MSSEVRPEDSSDDDEVHLKQQEKKDLELAMKLQESEGSDYEEYFEAYQKQKKRQKRTHNEENQDEDEEEKMEEDGTCSDTDEYLKEQDIKGKFAFCCKACLCPTEKKLKFQECFLNCGNSGNRYLYHRGCCHNEYMKNEDYLSPIQRQIEQLENFLEREEKMSTPKPLSHLQSKYNTARDKEVQYENEIEDNDITPILLETNPDYINYRRQFEKRVEDKSWNHPLRVLDLFSGIGSSVVALKRLQIPVHTIVHIEHDPVARYVCEYNHKDDGMTHIYYECFDETFLDDTELNISKVASVIHKHGPFDLVLAGAPCQEFSQVNAKRNQNKQSAKYLPLIGKLVKIMDSMQAECFDGAEKILFLSENVVFKRSEHIWLFYGRDEHGLVPIRLDAKDFSPAARNRFYWTNIPLEPINDIKTVAHSVASPKLLLDEGYIMVAEVRQTDCEKEFMTIKANTFMASKGRIDDDRMMRLKKVNDKDDTYYASTYSVREREIMSGFPEGYCEKALCSLFEQLTTNAFLKPELEKGKTYKDFLDKSLWHFVKCRYNFAPKSSEPFFEIKIGAPLEGKKSLSFYNEKEYCKRLIGNGWSIPVVEHLMKPLQKLFSSESLLEDYEGYDYNFPWPPYSDDYGAIYEV